MADVAKPAGIGGQLAIIAGLRWRVFRNSLRTTSDWLDVLALLVTSLLGGGFIASVGVGLGFAAHFFVVRGTPELLALPLVGVFFFWQFVPLALASAATGFDFRNLLRFPLRFPAFFLINLAYALFDPAAVGSLIWLACIATGVVMAQPDLLGWTLLVLAVFAATNLLLSRMAFAWLERLLTRRRSREALTALFILCLLSFQLISAAEARWEKRIQPYATAALPAVLLLPPGLAGKALASATRGNLPAILVCIGFLSAYSLAFGLLLHRRLRAQYLGEDLGESPAPVVVPAVSSSASASASLASSFLPGPVAAVFEKELRYLYRNTVAGLTLILPLILIIFFTISTNAPRPAAAGPGPLRRWPEMAFPVAAAYMFLIVAPFMHNCFAFDGRGVQLLFVAPVSFRDVLLGKNLIFCLILLVETAAVWLVVSFTFGPPRLMIAAATLSGLLFAALVHFIVGNWLSLAFPRRFEFGRFRRRASGMSVLLGFALQFLLLGLAALVTLLARWQGQIWIVPVVFLALSGIALLAYVATLDYYTRLALEKREVLTNQLCR